MGLCWSSLAFRLWSGSGDFVSVNKTEKKLIAVVGVRLLSLACIGLRWLLSDCVAVVGLHWRRLACVSSGGSGGVVVVYSGSV